MTGGETARQHIVLEHVVQPDAEVGSQQNGDQSQNKGDDVDFDGEGGHLMMKDEGG